MSKGISEKERALRDELAHAHGRMQPIIEKYDRGEKLTDADRREFDQAEKEYRDADRILKTMKRGTSAPDYAVAGPNPMTVQAPEIQGEPNEPLQRGQSMTEWVRRAAENGVQIQSSTGRRERVQHHDDGFLNEYWGQRFGVAKPGAELRALGEDTSGSGLAITPQSWVASFVDVLYAQTVLGRAGISRFAMDTELVNMPIFSTPVAPSWIAENSTVGIDANPAFAPLQFSAMGGFKDITLFSVELAQDAYIQGGLPGMLAQSVARTFALAVDVSGLQGVSGNAGNPGLVNESGFVSRGYTGASGTSGVSPTDTTEFSKVFELVANKNVDLALPEYSGAILSNPSVYGTINRTTSGSFPMYWPMPRDVEDMAWYRSANANILPATETASGGAPGALTGGALSSFYMGPWAFMMMGTHLDLTTNTLRERYIDYGQIGLWSFARWSIRTGHPEAFVRTGCITTS